MNISDYKDLYVNESEELLQALEDGIIGLEGEGDGAARMEELFRCAHNLKGISGAMGYEPVVQASHALESALDRLRKDGTPVSAAKTDILLHAVDMLRDLVKCTAGGYPVGGEGKNFEEVLSFFSDLRSRICEESEEGNGIEAQSAREGKCDEGDIRPLCDSRITSTRVELERLDRIMDLVGELIINRIRFSNLVQELGSKQLLDEITASGRLISKIQKEVMEARLVPVGQVFQRFNRLVRDLSREMGKNVKLEMHGSAIGLDRTVLEGMVDPLLHLIRNAMDHGIESPEEREAAGKSGQAKIILSAKREKNDVVLEISDDGRGIDTKRICEEGGKIGLTGNDESQLTDEELCGILATPGFSTSRRVDRFSGRGMGMNIVKKAVDSFGGSLCVNSSSGEGTTVLLHLPINLSIVKALLFCVCEDVHAVPIEYVVETTRVERTSLRSIGGLQVFTSKDGTLPVVRPGEIFELPLELEDNRYLKLIVMETGGGKMGLVVNRILGQQEIVIKTMPNMIRGSRGISGATILGSGKIAFIWDPNVLRRGRGTYESDKETIVSEN